MQGINPMHTSTLEVLFKIIIIEDFTCSKFVSFPRREYTFTLNNTKLIEPVLTKESIIKSSTLRTLSLFILYWWGGAQTYY
jgi:hypothetical protein